MKTFYVFDQGEGLEEYDFQNQFIVNGYTYSLWEGGKGMVGITPSPYIDVELKVGIVE